jgi:hypothetical protein
MCWVERAYLEVNKNHLTDDDGLGISLVDKYIFDFNLSCSQIINEGKVKNGLSRVTLVLSGDSSDVEKIKEKFWN